MCNLSALSQLIRIIAGLVLVAAAWLGPQTDLLSQDMKHLWLIGWIGLVPLITGIAAFCPLYAVIGKDHNRPECNKKAAGKIEADQNQAHQ